MTTQKVTSREQRKEKYHVLLSSFYMSLSFFILSCSLDAIVYGMWGWQPRRNCLLGVLRLELSQFHPARRSKARRCPPRGTFCRWGSRPPSQPPVASRCPWSRESRICDQGPRGTARSASLPGVPGTSYTLITHCRAQLPPAGSLWRPHR